MLVNTLRECVIGLLCHVCRRFRFNPIHCWSFKWQWENNSLNVLPLFRVIPRCVSFYWAILKTTSYWVLITTSLKTRINNGQLMLKLVWQHVGLKSSAFFWRLWWSVSCRGKVAYSHSSAGVEQKSLTIILPFAWKNKTESSIVKPQRSQSIADCLVAKQAGALKSKLILLEQQQNFVSYVMKVVVVKTRLPTNLFYWFSIITQPKVVWNLLRNPLPGPPAPFFHVIRCDRQMYDISS